MLKVRFVTEKDFNWGVFWTAGSGHQGNLTEPAVDVSESFKICDIVSENDRISVMNVGFKHLAGKRHAIDVPELQRNIDIPM